jgi:hypothetical protein
MHKIYITAESLLTDSYALALDIFERGYRPDFIVAVWRGGTPIGIAVQEMLTYLGVETDHIAIRTSSYTGIGERAKEVRVHGLDYLQQRLQKTHQLLLVDDVFDTGLSLQKIKTELQLRCGDNYPDIKIATPYFKPSNNRTDLIPDFYQHTSADWLVFPHELQGLDIEEVLQNKQELKPLQQRLAKILHRL